MRAILGLGAAALLLAGCGASGPPAKYYYYPAWGFSVATPSPPKVTDTPDGPDAPHHLTVVDDAGADDFAVYVDELAPGNRDIDQMADASAAAIAKSMGAEIGSQTYAATIQTTNQASGREFMLTKAGRPFLRVRIYLVGNHYYEIAGRTTFGPDDPAAKAFLDSFTILPGAPPATNATNAPAATNAN